MAICIECGGYLANGWDVANMHPDCYHEWRRRFVADAVDVVKLILKRRAKYSIARQMRALAQGAPHV